MNSTLDISRLQAGAKTVFSGLFRQSQRTSRAERAFADPRNLEDRLWTEYTARSADSENSLANARVLLMGFDGDELASVQGMMRAGGVASCAICRNIAQLRQLGGMDGAFTHLVINMDAFETISEAISGLLDLRASQSKDVVLLVSTSAAADGLGHSETGFATPSFGYR